MLRMRLCSSSKSLPPITRPAEKLWYLPMVHRTSKIWGEVESGTYLHGQFTRGGNDDDADAVFFRPALAVEALESWN